MPDYADAYADYLQAPDPTRLHAVVHALKPTIDYSLNSLNSSNDPVMRTRAKVLAAKAVERFDPASNTQLHTWVSHQLLPLRRLRRQTQTVVRLPERIQLDAFTLVKAEREFQDKHGRDPDVSELADFSKIPLKRIATIRNTMRKTPAESAMGDSMPPDETDYAPEAADYVHQDSDHIDRKILEHKTGYGGAEVLPPWAVAQKLGITPTQLTRRSQRMAMKIQRIEAQLKSLQ